MSKNNFSKKLSKIYDSAVEKNSPPRRAIGNTYGLNERFLNSITPPFAYILNRLNVSADLVTVISFVFLILGRIFAHVGAFLGHLGAF